MVFAVGTTNNAKILAVKKALQAIANREFNGNSAYKDADVRGFNVESQVNNQPMSDEESIKGAINRAKNALACDENAEYGIGIESGLQMISNRYFESGWVVVINRQGAIGMASSNRYEIRDNLMSKIESGMELSGAIESVTGRKDVRTTSGVSGIITNGIIDRCDSYVDAIIFAFGPFVSPAEIWL